MICNDSLYFSSANSFFQWRSYMSAKASYAALEKIFILTRKNIHVRRRPRISNF